MAVVVLNGDALECDSYGCWERSVTEKTNNVGEEENAPTETDSNTGISKNWVIIQPPAFQREQVEKHTDDETERAIRDVNAQEAMVKWAKFSAFVACLALFGLLWTLYETRRIGQAQVRAYLSINQIDLRSGLGNAFFLNFHILNCGASPAKKVKVDAVCELYIRETMGSQTMDLDSQGQKEIEIEINSVAAQATENRMDSTPEFTPEIDRQLNTTNQGIDVEVSGRISWKDVFGRGDSEDFTFSLMDVGWWMLEERDGNNKIVRYRDATMSPERLYRP